jgi:hypothetical protein
MGVVNRSKSKPFGLGMASLSHLLLSLIVAMMFSTAALAQSNLAQNHFGFVEDGVRLDDSLPRPDTFLGFEPGKRHIRHDQLLAYLKALAAASPRIDIETIGYTHEGRELVNLFITKPSNLNQRESLRQQHLQGDGPLVVWLGYSIHGNEASGSNASPWVAWYLASSQEAWVDELLEDTVILLDPSFNPDGLDRFATWTNGQAGLNPSFDRHDWEHTEPWPNGRTNHYWFDLNRDWLPLVHPESRARVAQFQRWRPHVLTDHHEMGHESTFFFQPGVPSRTNALTPELNQELTGLLGEFHAKALDASGELFFSREVFDDYYYGKGSTYPDVQGSVGILFEQASTRGKQVDTSFGKRTFIEGMLNHYRVSFSTLRGAHEIQDRLKAFRRRHDTDSMKNAAKGAWIVGDDRDPARVAHMLNVMAQHQVEIYRLDEDLTIDGQRFAANEAWIIPRQQRQALLVEAMFSRPTSFKDETFYDVSGFTLALAYDVPHKASRSVPAKGVAFDADHAVAKSSVSGALPIAFAVPWHQLHAPALLQQLTQNNVRVRIVTKATEVQTVQGGVALAAGDLLIPTGIQDDAQAVQDELAQWLAGHPMVVHAIQQGRALSGPDLGSGSMRAARKIRPAMVVGDGLNPYDAGEIWHLADQQLGLSLTRVEWYRLNRFPLDDYTHLLMVAGNYGQLSEALKQKITTWVKNGGHLVLTEGASTWSESLPWGSKPDNGQAKEEGDDERRPYGEFQADQAERIIGGAIMNLDIDITHPLGYGLQRGELPIMKNNLITLQMADSPYGTVAVYDENPLMAGYASTENREALAGKAAITASVVGSGRVIRFADNPLFRGHWLGSSRVYVNALYFSHLIQRTQLPKAPR